MTDFMGSGSNDDFRDSHPSRAAANAIGNRPKDGLVAIAVPQDIFNGGPGDDTLAGTPGADTINGNGGNDTLGGAGGADTIDGGDGDDTIYLASSSGQAGGGKGNDTFYGYGLMYGGAGNDVFNLTGDSSRAFGDDGDDTINGGSGFFDQLFGGAGADTIHGGDGFNYIYSAGTRDAYGQLDDTVDRGTEHDRLFGGAGNDTISIGYGDDADGGEGNNTLILSLIGGTSGATVDGPALSAGSISIGGGVVSHFETIQKIYGSAFADTITMPTQSYYGSVEGGAGDDQLTGGGSAVSFDGGDGDDKLIGSSAGDYLRGGAGVDLVYGRDGDDTISISPGDIAPGDMVDGGNGFDTVSFFSNTGATTDLTGVSFSNVELLQASDPISLSLEQFLSFRQIQAQTIKFLTGGSASLAGMVLYYGSTITLADAATTFDMTDAAISSYSIYTINGGAGADVITTLSGNDKISGGAGDDVISSGAGSDTLIGGAGRDTFHAGDDNDSIYVYAGDYIAGEIYDGGAGNDALILPNGTDLTSSTLVSIETLGFAAGGSVTMTGAQLQGLSALAVYDYSGYVRETVNLTTGGAITFSGSTDLVTFNLAATDTALNLSGISRTLGVTVNGDGGNDTITGSQFADTLNGGVGNDVLDGGGSADTLNGGAGNDGLYGGAGNDTLDGGVGADAMSGGTGDDVYYVDDSGDTVVENANEGVDEIRTTLASTTLSANFENLTGWLATGQTLIGNALANTLTGGFGDDILDGGAGADTMNGGFGSDIYYVDDVGDLILDQGTGTDEVRTTLVSYTIGSTIENLAGLLSTGQTLNGNSLSNVITGGSGDDIIDAKAGNDTMIGGLGNDVYYVDSADDIVTELVGGGTDEVRTILTSYTLAANVENLAGLLTTAQTLTGNALDNVITGGIGNDELFGGAGNDTLDGGAGLDRLAGGTGNDIYLINSAEDVVVENFGEGTDEVRTTLASYTLAANVENLTGLLATGQILTGNGLDNTIRGGLGADTLAGGTGNDRYVLTDLLDTVTEAAGSGTDTIDLALTTAGIFTLAANVENLVVGGVSTEAHGNALANVIVGGNAGHQLFGEGGDDSITGGTATDYLFGGAGNDTLNGAAGADNLFGGVGNDTFYADRSDDLVFENADEGTDTVITSAGFYLYANIENLTLAAGAGDIFGVGNELANVMNGNEGSNLLIAGAGADLVHGGAGVDSLFGQDGADQLFGDAGVDYLVGGTGDDMLDGGTGADALYGEDGNDVLWGGTDFQTDILVGGAGNDVLHGDSGLGDYDLMDGGAGDDTYYVDTPADLTFEAVGGGTDTVHANIVGAGYYLYANVENLILDGITPFGVGNELNNQLTGNASSNYLLGGAGDDVLNGKGDNDVLFGESGADTFVFEHGTGADVIGDFTAGTDKIDLTAIGYSWTQVQNALHENGGNTAIDLGGGDLIVLNGVTAAQLHASDFILAGGSGSTVTVSAVALAATPPFGIADFQGAINGLAGPATDERPSIAHAVFHDGIMDSVSGNGLWGGPAYQPVLPIDTGVV